MPGFALSSEVDRYQFPDIHGLPGAIFFLSVSFQTRKEMPCTVWDVRDKSYILLEKKYTARLHVP
jgi:hypothetical protein